MTPVDLYRMSFHGPLHVSSGGYGEESVDAVIHSDTLFSALCMAASRLLGDDAVAILLDDASLRITSAFPFLGDELLMPKPVGCEFANFGDLTYAQQKVAKKLRFLPLEILTRFLEGGSVSLDVDRLRGGWWITSATAPPILVTTAEVPRVTLDRTSGAAGIFHVAEVRFCSGAGLYALVHSDQAATRGIVRTCMRLLADEGVGADRTVGKGQFTLSEGSLELPLEGPAPVWYLASLYAPSTAEHAAWDAAASRYELLERKGWISAPGQATQRRKRMWTLQEGSTLAFSQPLRLSGGMPDVLDNPDGHRIVRHARPFALPMHAAL